MWLVWFELKKVAVVITCWRKFANFSHVLLITHKHKHTPPHLPTNLRYTTSAIIFVCSGVYVSLCVSVCVCVKEPFKLQLRVFLEEVQQQIQIPTIRRWVHQHSSSFAHWIAQVLIREHSSTVISARLATLNWSLAREWNLCVQTISTLEKKKRTGGEMICWTSLPKILACEDKATTRDHHPVSMSTQLMPSVIYRCSQISWMEAGCGAC